MNQNEVNKGEWEMFVRGGAPREKRRLRAIEGEKWILGSSVRFLWICTPVLQCTKAEKQFKQKG